ncbi:putative kinesin light chain [Diplogelasinospora grovesii]|uniref:Kinesin light chain n=1 Tax=Diplogelasinospora grovesii TaxID=303347 RepID=A0AAN6MYL2_9PEZI|nr:putative kinesin light chain [Diplogelasinospora grovesii]
MLPEAVPEARIFTYDWDANFFENAPVQTLLGHADNLLALVLAESRGSEIRPIIFIASCFGGLVLAQALTRASEEGSAYRQILRFTVGVVFLATPFHGTDAKKQAQWQVVVGGIMEKQTSDQLVRDLNERSDHVYNRVKKFAEMANRDSVRLPIHCFYETKRTMMLRKLLSRGLAERFSTGFTHKILVKESSACIPGFPGQGLDATHSGMNKFESPGSSNFKLVKEAIKQLAKDAPTVLKRRENSAQEHHFVVAFGRNKDFVGRKEILSDLLKRIPPSRDEDDCQRTAIEGLGGVGKTQIALEAAFQVRGDCSVFWVPAVDATSFENAYRDIGRRLGIAGMDEDKADVKALVKAALSHESAGRWLLIVDNADDMELLFSATGTGLSDYLPFSRMGSILFTTRNHKVVVRLGIPERGIINTAEMSQEEATELLQRNLKESQTRDTKNTADLLDLLANLPLAIKQASAYMAKEQISTLEYLELFRSSDKDMIDLLSRNFEDRYRYQGIQNQYQGMQNAVATTWLISFRQISHDNPLAADYLRFMCFLAEKDIPESLLSPARNTQTVEAIGALKAYAFITQREGRDTFDVHRLVRLAMQNWLDKGGELEECITRAIQRLAEAFPFPEHENRDVWVKYLPHAQTALEFRKGSSDEETESYLLYNVAVSYHILGKYKEAEQMCRQTLELKEKVLGKEHPGTLSSMNNLAETLRHQGKYEEAGQMHRQTLELREKVLGKEHPDTLSSINNLANVLKEQGKDEEAGQMHRQTLELKEKVLGKEHPGTLISMNNLANVLKDQGRYKEAEQMCRQTLELTEKVLDKEHPITLSSMNNLAETLRHQGKYEEAGQMHRQTLELREKVLGKEHPDTLSSINNLANVLKEQGKDEEAGQMHRQTLELKEKVLGKEHPGTLISMNNLANVLKDQGRYKEAEQMCRQTLELTEKVLDKEHPITLSSMNNLAETLRHQGKYEEAGQMHRQTLELMEKVLGKEHPETLMSMNNLAAVLGNQGRYEEAEPIFRQTLELREKVLGKQHPNTVMSRDHLAICLRRKETGKGL